MNKNILIASFMIFAVNLLSQEEPVENKETKINTIFNEGLKIKSWGGYGAPIVGGTQIKGNMSVYTGGKGGVIINRKYAFGGVGMGFPPGVRFNGDDLKGNKDATLRLDMGMGGLFFEYLHNVESSVNFSIPINFMIGGGHQ